MRSLLEQVLFEPLTDDDDAVGVTVGEVLDPAADLPEQSVLLCKAGVDQRIREDVLQFVKEAHRMPGFFGELLFEAGRKVSLRGRRAVGKDEVGIPFLFADPVLAEVGEKIAERPCDRVFALPH